jgi:predicted RNase H-like nuclease (RuvC/YqgF family)
MVEYDKLKKENKDLRNQVKELNKTIETLKANLKHSREETRKANNTNGVC